MAEKKGATVHSKGPPAEILRKWLGRIRENKSWKRAKKTIFINNLVE